MNTPQLPEVRSQRKNSHQLQHNPKPQDDRGKHYMESQYHLDQQLYDKQRLLCGQYIQEQKPLLESQHPFERQQKSQRRHSNAQTLDRSRQFCNQEAPHQLSLPSAQFSPSLSNGAQPSHRQHDPQSEYVSFDQRQANCCPNHSSYTHQEMSDPTPCHPIIATPTTSSAPLGLNKRRLSEVDQKRRVRYKSNPLE
jgi:hypothetical protein